MPAPSTSWTDVLNAQLTAGKPLTQELMRQLRDDLRYLYEWMGDGYVAAKNHRHDGLDSAPVALATQLVPFLYDLGDASDGDVTFSGSGNIAPGLYQYHDVTINTGVTLTLSKPGPLVIKCTGTFTMSGTAKIDAKGLGLYRSVETALDSVPLPCLAGVNPGNLAIGGAGGMVDGVSTINGNIARPAGQDPTTNSGATPSTQMKEFFLLTFPHVWGGGPGGGNEAYLFDGGEGGGLIVIVADEIDCHANSRLDVSGNAGRAADATGAGHKGGGGGGGGVVVVACRTVTNAYTATISAGAGGANSGAIPGGQAGGSGWTADITLPA